MSDTPDLRPWEQLDALAGTRDAEGLESFLHSLPSSETARALSHLSPDEQSRILETLQPEDAAKLLGGLPTPVAADLVERLSVEVAGNILLELPSDDQADLVGEMDEDDADAMLAAIDPAERREIVDLARWAEDVAGGLMVTELIRVRSDWTPDEVIEQLRRGAEEVDYEIQYVYVVDEGDRLVGVLGVRDLLLSARDQVISEIMIDEPITVLALAPLEELEDVFEGRSLLALPVVGHGGELLGLVTRASVDEAVTDRAGADHLKSQGIVGGEEFRSMPLLQRSRRRLSWLSVNVVLNVIAASVIALFEDTLSAVIALALFLPIISDMSGCSGNQAVAVSIRELALGLVKPVDVLHVWIKEVGVGLINGVVLGALIGVIAWTWKGNVFLGLVVGGALAVNTLIAVSIGGAIPLLLKRMKMDPALASGPVLTTITDICGFLLLLGMATLALPRLLA